MRLEARLARLETQHREGRDIGYARHLENLSDAELEAKYERHYVAVPPDERERIRVWLESLSDEDLDRMKEVPPSHNHRSFG
jgi:hypothetical protein